MANKKISELTVAGALTGDEKLEVVQDGENRQTTAQDIADLATATGGVQTVTGSVVNNTDPANPVINADPSGAAATAQSNAQAYADSKVSNTITNGVTTVAPAQDVVFDQLALKAPLASPVFTGTPTAPTPSNGDNSQKLATTQYVDTNLNASKFLQALYFQQNFI
jgi:hypothetical protein